MGFDLKQNSQKASGYLGKAAKQYKNNLAQYLIGTLLLPNGGYAKDCVEAMKWLKLSAQNGWDDAKIRLGLLYQYGDSLTADSETAKFWYNRVIEKKNACKVCSYEDTLKLFNNKDLTIKFDMTLDSYKALHKLRISKSEPPEVVAGMCSHVITRTQRLGLFWFIIAEVGYSIDVLLSGIHMSTSAGNWDVFDEQYT
jgi:hypothetical protein